MRLLGDRVSRQVASQIAMEHDWDTLRDAGCLAGSKLQADALVTLDSDLATRLTASYLSLRWKP